MANSHKKKIIQRGMKAVEKVYAEYLVACLRSGEEAKLFEQWFKDFRLLERK